MVRNMPLGRRIRKSFDMYLMMAIPLFVLVVFRYVPLWFNAIAFFDFQIFGGLPASEYVGLKHFTALLSDPMFSRVFTNTLVISVYGLVAGFPFPIILALMLNEMRLSVYKRTIQTLIYLPHFLSWVVFGNIISNVLSPSTGIVNQLLRAAGGTEINFLGSKQWFRTVLVASGILKNAGWGTIVYLAALTQIDPSLYESAEIDGAGEMCKVFHITLPSIAPTVMMLFILNLGSIMTANFQQIFVLYSPSVYKVSDVFETYIYRTGIIDGDYSYTTAMGLFQSLITTVLVFAGNDLSRRLAGRSIW